MFDIYWGDIELTTVVLAISLVVLLPVQILLCFRVKSLTVRLLPAILLSAAAMLCIVFTFTATGWNGLFYAFFAIFAGFMVCVCGIGWGIWAVIRWVRKEK